MKTTSYALLAAAFLFLAGSCEKEKPSPVNAAVESAKPSGPESNSKSLISLTNPVVTFSCNAQFCDVINIVDQFKVNMFEISNNHGGTAIKYAIYELSSTPIIPNTSLYAGALIAQFNCSKTTTRYAGNSLNNGATIVVYAMHTTDTPPLSVVMNGTALVSPAQITDSDYEVMVMGNHKGTPGCGDPNG
jgi:hypothetical protein